MCHKICISSYRHHDELYTYFQKVVSVMMKEVDEVDGGVTVIEYFKKNVENDLERPAVCGPHHAESCEEDDIA